MFSVTLLTPTLLLQRLPLSPVHPVAGEATLRDTGCFITKWLSAIEAGI